MAALDLHRLVPVSLQARRGWSVCLPTTSAFSSSSKAPGTNVLTSPGSEDTHFWLFLCLPLKQLDFQSSSAFPSTSCGGTGSTTT